MSDWAWQNTVLPLGVSAIGAICWLAFMRPAAYARFQRVAIFLLIAGCMAYLAYVVGFLQGSLSAIRQVESGISKDIVNKTMPAWPLYGAVSIFIFLIVLEILSSYIDLNDEKTKSDKN